MHMCISLNVFFFTDHYSVCEILVQAGADTTASVNGVTPVELAQDMGHTHIYELLTQSNNNEDKPDKQAMDQS